VGRLTLSSRAESAAKRLSGWSSRIRAAPRGVRSGRLERVSGLMLEVGGLPMTIGNRAAIASRHGWVECECVGFSGGTTFLMPIDPAVNVAPGAVVYPANTPALAGGRFVPIESAPPLPIGDTLMGRIVDGYGRALDGHPVGSEAPNNYRSTPINPLHRQPINEPLDSGVRSINAMLTVGRGQRVGIFAGSGVGKSVLLGMLARRCVADVVVIGLVGNGVVRCVSSARIRSVLRLSVVRSLSLHLPTQVPWRDFGAHCLPLMSQRSFGIRDVMWFSSSTRSRDLPWHSEK